MTWGVLLPFSLGLFYHMFLNYPYDDPNNYLVTLTPSAILRIYLFGALVVGQVAMMILSGKIDALLLSIGSLPIFENYVFAIGTVWNSLQPIHVHPNNRTPNGSSGNHNPLAMTSQKLATDLATLEVLTIRPMVRYLAYAFLSTLLLLVCQDLFPKTLISLPLFSLLFSYSWGHLFVYLISVMAITRDLSGPMRRWANWYYSTIKDENYLIGLELQNSEAVSYCSPLLIILTAVSVCVVCIYRRG
jgi:hypothetical protein